MVFKEFQDFESLLRSFQVKVLSEKKTQLKQIKILVKTHLMEAN